MDKESCGAQISLGSWQDAPKVLTNHKDEFDVEKGQLELVGW